MRIVDKDEEHNDLPALEPNRGVITPEFEFTQMGKTAPDVTTRINAAIERIRHQEIDQWALTLEAEQCRTIMREAEVWKDLPGILRPPTKPDEAMDEHCVWTYGSSYDFGDQFVSHDDAPLCEDYPSINSSEWPTVVESIGVSVSETTSDISQASHHLQPVE
ncbi:hypothetical protein B0H17DRAFT_1205724 [Mycena rosella]|uniref:Uncharacterized protein n=1 Tax=Mycena rosella TaxID=1033263 RepID=A0AAD7D6W9_MYCRO|nr:hypothetical protein B0H17DRAFT_1205724 [Mycena rosella]